MTTEEQFEAWWTQEHARIIRIEGASSGVLVASVKTVIKRAWLAACTWQCEQDAKIAESFQLKQVMDCQVPAYYCAGEIAIALRAQDA